MLDGFKKFILRGNVVDMAVGVVIGAAFAGVVNGLTKAFLNPLIKLAAGGEKFSTLQFTIRGVPFPIDELINASISFVLIAAAVYFLVVLPVNALVARMTPVVRARSRARRREHARRPLRPDRRNRRRLRAAGSRRGISSHIRWWWSCRRSPLRLPSVPRPTAHRPG